MWVREPEPEPILIAAETIQWFQHPCLFRAISVSISDIVGHIPQLTVRLGGWEKTTFISIRNGCNFLWLCNEFTTICGGNVQ